MRIAPCPVVPFVVAFVIACLPAFAVAQPGVPAGMPLVVDMQKVEIGAWAEYKMTMGTIALTSRWALVNRDAKSNTLEMTTTGGPVAKAMVLRLVLPADPTSPDKPTKPMAVQFGDDPPMLVPKDTPSQRFQRPDEKHLVGKEDLKLAAGSFKTAHYREKNAMGTVDIWVDETVLPLGIVKVVTTPEPDKTAPAAMQVPAATMELAATGKGAKAVITRKPRPFDESKMNGFLGRPRP
jgi:hypothetical protein